MDKEIRKREISKDPDDDTNKVGQESYDIEFGAMLVVHIKGVAQLKENILSAYSTIMENYCSKTMQIRIEEIVGIDSRIKNNTFYQCKLNF